METAQPNRPCLVVEEVEHAWAWSPDSRYLALEAEGLRLIQLDRRLESGEVPFPAPVEVDDVSGLAWSPDSRQLLYLTEGKLRLLDPELPPPRTLMEGLGDVYWGWVAWSPDGNQAAIALGEEQSTIWLWRRVDGQRTRVPFPEECKQMDPRGISWSPDSSRFAVEWNEDTRSVLYLVEATHGTRWKAFEVKVRMGGVGIFGPVWSPDGKTLALIACTYRSNERSLTSRLVAGRLWLVRPPERRIQGLWPRQLRGSMPTYTCLAWTPDGRELLLVAEGPQQRRLVSLAVDGSEARFLTGEEEFVLETAMSPDGRWIAFEHGSLRRREGEVSWFSGDTGGVSETPYHFDIQTDVSVMRWDGTQRVSLGAVLKGSGQEGN
jgi:Tol biopolymer transport system component